jgi:hypothetical protein
VILYILHFIVQEKSIFDWGKLISIEISSQLSHYKKDRKLFMASYLIFSIVHFCQFPNLTISKRVNCEIDIVTFFYQNVGRLVVVIDVNPSHGFWTARLMKVFGHEGQCTCRYNTHGWIVYIMLFLVVCGTSCGSSWLRRNEFLKMTK